MLQFVAVQIFEVLSTWQQRLPAKDTRAPARGSHGARGEENDLSGQKRRLTD